MSNLKLDDIRNKIQSLKQQKLDNKDNIKTEFPFTDINRDTLNSYKKSINI